MLMRHIHQDLWKLVERSDSMITFIFCTAPASSMDEQYLLTSSNAVSVLMASRRMHCTSSSMTPGHLHGGALISGVS